MGADLFISYAWTSKEHREWVRLLAATLKAAGFDVLVDADVEYGNPLSGFMRRAVDCRHVLMVVDENYVERADRQPDSGVGIENGWLVQAHPNKPVTWLSVVFKDNPTCRLPGWLASSKLKGHSFDADAARGDFPGSEQVEALWRWLQDLPANRDHAATVATLLKRRKRLESIDRERDPSSWANPGTEGVVRFDYERSPDKAYTLGYGEFGFRLTVSTCGAQTVYVMNDHVHAVGVNRARATSHGDMAAQLTPGRYVVAAVGDQVILQNHSGVLCLVDILDAAREVMLPDYKPATLGFSFRVLLES